MKIRHLTRFAQLAAWTAIAVIAYFTLTRVNSVYSIYYKMSPLLLHLGMKKFAAVEHVVAFAVFGALFYAAYPKHLVMVCCIVLGSAIALELLQMITPDRHGTLLDALEKMVGGACGVFITRAVLDFWYRKRAAPN